MKKKYVTVLCDGMADYPDARGLTPMTEAHKPTMDSLCAMGMTGLVKTVPDGMKPGSDVCNLAALGYEPQDCYTGRSPLEALSMGIRLGADDVSYRVNLVTLEGGEIMLDYSSGEITTEESARLISALTPLFSASGIELYAGISYRHAAVIRHGTAGKTECTPPHDILGKPYAEYLPRGFYGEKLAELIKSSREILRSHPVNLDRINRGKNPATAVWFWGEGTKPKLRAFEEKFGKTATVISAVDLLKGIGVAGGMRVVDVPTATGTVDTDYEAKAAAATAALETSDFVFVHLEGPDECGHQGDRKGKITAIERIDARILKPIYDELEGSGAPFAITVMPDHATPLSVRTHTREPVPFMIYDSETSRGCGLAFSEEQATRSEVFFPRGSDVIKTMFASENTSK